MSIWRREQTESEMKQEKRNKNKHLGIAKQKRTLKLFVNELFKKKNIVQYNSEWQIQEAEAAEVVLPYSTKFYSNDD